MSTTTSDFDREFTKAALAVARSTARPFAPSPWLLQAMVEDAFRRSDAAHEAAVKAAAEDRFERAVAHNKKVARERREHDVRRRINAGDSTI